MRSIRRRLTVTLLLGLGLLWVGAGAGVWMAVRSSLVKSVDAELALDAQVLRFVVAADEHDEESEVEAAGPGRRAGMARRLQSRLPEYDEMGSGAFYQGWSEAGEVLDRSPSLGERDLPLSGEPLEEPFFETGILSDGTSVRLMTFLRVPTGGGRGRAKGERRRSDESTRITIARDLVAVDQTLKSLTGGIALVGLLAGAAAVLLVGGALRSAFRPLRDLGEAMHRIDASSLDARFDAENVPQELKAVSAKLNELLSRVEAGFERERRFSADLAHEMRTPVAELKMLAEVALKWPEQADSKGTAETLAIAEQLESTIETLLLLARFESGETKLEVEEVSILNMVSEGWAPHEKLAEEKGLAFSICDEGRQATFLTDPNLLRHILNNLLSNAVEYSPAGGQVSVTGGRNRMEVSNAVEGLRREDVDHLFDRYWRSSEARGDRGHVGLGLSLAKTCADVLGLDLCAGLEDGGQVIRFVLAPRRGSEAENSLGPSS